MSDKESLLNMPELPKSTDPPEVGFYWKQDENLEPVAESKVTKDGLEDEVLEAAKEAKEESTEEKSPNEKSPLAKALVQRLRLRDRYFNKTCACCGRRVPLAQIQDGKGEVCDKCRG